MTTHDATAKRINKLLQEQHITLYRLEQKSGVYHGVMDRIMKGQNQTVSLATLCKIARGFGMSIVQFLDDEVFISDELEID